MGVWRDVHNAIGGFDEAYTVGGDDNDYAWRCQLAGFALVYNPDAIVDYRLRDNYRDFWKQTFGYGRAAVQNYANHRSNGLPGYNNPWLLPLMAVTLAARNPLLPRAITRLIRDAGSITPHTRPARSAKASSAESCACDPRRARGPRKHRGKVAARSY